MITLTRRVQFSAAHRYFRPEWDEERNAAFFGENVKLHGHNYVLEATLRGEVDPETGMAVDLGALDRALARVAAGLGYRDLSQGVAGLEGQVPTTENLALYAWNHLGRELAGAKLVRVRLYESPDLHVEVSDASGECP